MSDTKKVITPTPENDADIFVDSLIDLTIEMFLYEHKHGTLDVQKLKEKARKEVEMG